MLSTVDVPLNQSIESPVVFTLDFTRYWQIPSKHSHDCRLFHQFSAKSLGPQLSYLFFTFIGASLQRPGSMLWSIWEVRHWVRRSKKIYPSVQLRDAKLGWKKREKHGIQPISIPRSWVRGFISTCTRNVYPQVLVSLFFNVFLQGVLSAQDSDGTRFGVCSGPVGRRQRCCVWMWTSGTCASATFLNVIVLGWLHSRHGVLHYPSTVYLCLFTIIICFSLSKEV